MVPLPSSAISPREHDVLRALVRGRTNEQIASGMCVSSRTVQSHVRNLMEKTGTQNRTHLAVTAICTGLVPMPSCDDLA